MTDRVDEHVKRPAPKAAGVIRGTAKPVIKGAPYASCRPTYTP